MLSVCVYLGMGPLSTSDSSRPPLALSLFRVVYTARRVLNDEPSVNLHAGVTLSMVMGNPRF